MNMLDFFKEQAEKMKSAPTLVGNSLDEVDAKYGTNALSFINSHFAPAQSAQMIDTADNMQSVISQTGMVSPAAALLESNAQSAPAGGALQMQDPRSNDRGLLNEETDYEREQLELRESYENVPQPYYLNKDMHPYGKDDPSKVYT